MTFPPIAIVGAGCVLPGALNPEELWAAVVAGRDLTGPAPPDRWRIARDLVLRPGSSDGRDGAWSDRGGHVHGFEAVFDPEGFEVPAERIAGLDPLFQWVLYCGREALRGIRGAWQDRAGVILGNLSFPSESLARLGESAWLERAGAPAAAGGPLDPANRFMSGLPALLAARALGLGGPAFALDAACASSLYAIKLACDRLHDGTADLMLAGGVNRADDLFLHVGFTALQALSRSGRSRPFHREADGLLPAEGAGLVALKRLEDARAAGDAILGVVRGVGLSNDGRGLGFLAPSPEGQVRAIRRAYEMSGLEPRDVSLIECHATGTSVGDATEIRSTGEVFLGCEGVPVGSLKSNLGHLITAAGVAGLLKVLAAIRARTRPPTLHSDDPVEALDGSPFRLLTAAEPWESSGLRRAAVSAFGFGGNNAHLIVEEHDPLLPTAPSGRDAPPNSVAVVGVGASVAGGECVADLCRTLLTGTSRVRPVEGIGAAAPAESVALDVGSVRFPPRDLQLALAQQLLVLRAAHEAVASTEAIPAERTGVFVGMQCDAEIARYGARWRLAQWLRDAGREADSRTLGELRDGVAPLLEPAGVVGTMPNVPANRLNSQFDFRGPGFTVSAEELSGLVALDLGVRALRAGELDAAVVGAVDMSVEPVHASALAALAPERGAPGDGAVALVLRRLDDARKDGQRVLAVLDEACSPDLRLGLASGAAALTPLVGHSHAASGLIHVVGAVLACHQRVRPSAASAAAPWLPGSGPRAAEVAVESLGGGSAAVVVREDEQTPAPPFLFGEPPRFHVYSGGSRADVLAALESGHESEEGPARLVLVASTDDDLRERHARARALLRGEEPNGGSGIAFRERPIAGDLAFAFTGPAGTYRNAGRELALALPSLVDSVSSRWRGLRRAASWLYAEGRVPGAIEKLWGSSFVSQLHAELSLRVLGLRPQAAIGLSSGETNALFALGAWGDVDGLVEALEESRVYSRELGGEFDAVRRAWNETRPVRWTNWRILAPVERVEEALAGEERVHLTVRSTATDCVIGGEAEPCARVVARVGAERARPLDYDLAVHCPELAECEDVWRALHLRPTETVPRVRFYTHATCSHYELGREAVANALTAQALRTVDFPRLVEAAWHDGVRTFVEHGPSGGCSRWISSILGEREHLAVALDEQGRDGVEQAADTVAQLLAAGVPVDWRSFEARLSRQPKPMRAQLRFPAHMPAPRFPSFALRAGAAERLTAPRMPPAPLLPLAAEQGPAPLASLALPTAGSDLGAAMTAQPSSAAGRLAARVVEEHERIAGIHGAFLEAQARLHRQFLDLMGSGRPRSSSSTMAVEPEAPLPPAAPPAQHIQPRPTPARPEVREPAFPGPSFSREQLELLASDKISRVFGPLFAEQDSFRRQVRMPEPPLLLADRVLGIAGEPRSMGRGTIWTETDVRPDAWYVHEGHMPAGIMIESGQADLLLISWLGIDFLNRGDRVYRLLGCDLTYHGGLPVPGDTLRYDIHVDAHARHGDVRLFFFHYDCRIGGTLRLSVRDGQAGFFADNELLESGGILWDAESGERTAEARVASPAATPPRRLSREQLRAFAERRTDECFGAGFERARCHLRTPTVASGRMLLLQEVTDFDPEGGPWRRGYLRATWDFSPGDWFFEGHFKDDPCMPGTLMLEGCLQAMAVYLAGLGLTLRCDGWRFEPVPEETYRLRCRGQAVPTSRQLVYEVFVDELVSEPVPTLYADLLCTVDGLKAFHCRRMGLRLVPDWPLSTRPDLLSGHQHSPVAASADGVRFDYPAILGCALGRPSEALGSLFAAFDGPKRLSRLPGPPYDFMTRVTSIDGRFGSLRPGATIETEYDVPAEAWFFDDGGTERMPFCALLEAHLQPCGWMCLAVGVPLSSTREIFFRNLDGTGTLHSEIGRGAGTLKTRVRLVELSRSGGMAILSFDVASHIDGRPVYSMQTSFGFFPHEALVGQVGLPTTDEERARFEAPDEVPIDRDRLDAGPRMPRLPEGRVRMVDRITGYWPRAGAAGLGRMRCEKLVDAGAWFFKAHFYQDPVQPGSLGLQAMLELLQAAMLARGMAEGISSPRFEAVATSLPHVWKYRGQVLPENARVSVEVEITEARSEGATALAVANAWLWVDGKRIYAARDLAARIVSAPDRQATEKLP
jgi:acyl transferase domain-containing protein/3-hydroxymyristoyl/3-hydroxydecanoyl-(acyl carrier protein) dehydratase